MGRANGLLNNIAIDRAIFNRLSAVAINARNVISRNSTNNNNNSVSYLFSLDILEASWDGSTLTFNKQTETGDNNISLIRFTDRPYRFDKHFVGEEAEIYIDQLFVESPEGFNSFSKDPPNGILVVNSSDSSSLKGKQEAYELKLKTVSNGKISMILNLLQNQNNIQPFTNQPISLFIDNSSYVGQCKWAGTNVNEINNHPNYRMGIKVNNNNLFTCAGRFTFTKIEYSTIYSNGAYRVRYREAQKYKNGNPINNN